MDPRLRDTSKNDRQEPSYDKNLKEFNPLKEYNTLEIRNKDLKKMNDNLHGLIKKCEESIFLREFSNSNIRLNTRDLMESKEKMEVDILKMYEELDMKAFFDSIIEDNSSFKEPPPKKSNKKCHKSPSEIQNIVENEPVKKKPKSVKSIPSKNNFKCSITQIKKKSKSRSKKKCLRIPINRPKLRCKKKFSSILLSGTMFTKKDIEKFTKTVANERFLEHEVIPTQAKGPSYIDPSNIKIETESGTRLTRSVSRKNENYKNICFYHRLHAQIRCLYCVFEEDIQVGATETNIEEDLGYYYFN